MTWKNKKKTQTIKNKIDHFFFLFVFWLVEKIEIVSAIESRLLPLQLFLFLFIYLLFFFSSLPDTVYGFVFTPPLECIFLTVNTPGEFLSHSFHHHHRHTHKRHCVHVLCLTVCEFMYFMFDVWLVQKRFLRATKSLILFLVYVMLFSFIRSRCYTIYDKQ